MDRKENVIIVLPHQDDEMFIFHRMRYLLRQRRRLFVVWVTDGAANNPEVRKSLVGRLFLPFIARESDETIRQVRKRESLSMMGYLKIREENLRFLSYPSGQIKNCFAQIVDSLADIFLQLNPQEIYTVAFDHSEFEHDACNAAAKFASRDLPPEVTLYEFPVFNVCNGIPRSHWLIPYEGIRIERTPFDKQDERDRLRLFRQLFKSQWFIGWRERITSFLPSEYKKLGEPYRIIPDYDYSKQIDGAKVTYVPKSLRFEDFRKMVSDCLR
jgi:LmbE family N-acetylglucosaminyl deacetylase